MKYSFVLLISCTLLLLQGCSWFRESEGTYRAGEYWNAPYYINTVQCQYFEDGSEICWSF